jgi:tagaturonate reductase
MTLRTEKVIQFGECGFLRGFADWMLQIVNEKSDFNGSVVVVQPIEKGLCNVLAAQNCEYTHVCRGIEGVDVKKIDVISRTLNPFTDFDGYLKLAEQKELKYIISNTTEAGIACNEGDKLSDRPAKSFPAKVTQLLYKRFLLKLDGFVFLPCELIDKNGESLKKCILKIAKDWNLEKEFSEWVENENVFCNTLVDRINTGFPKDEKIDLGYTDNMLNTSEYFHLWVIEGYDRLKDEIPFEKCGLNVIITNELERYRTRKVRILNGAHTSLVAYAMLSGLKTVKECTDNEVMLKHLNKCIFEEIIPTLDLPEDELKAYANDVLKRFSNPYIKHYLASISLNSISKFKVRVLPSIKEYIKRFDKAPQALMLSFKKLIEFYKTGTPNDDEDIIKFIKNASVQDILKNELNGYEEISIFKDGVTL